MRKLALATIVALAATLTAGTVTEAAADTLVIRHVERHYDRDHRHGWRYERHHARHCFTRKVRIHRHGRVIIERTRVCR